MPQTNERRREIYKTDRESILAHQREYLRNNPEKAKEYNRRSYRGHVEARHTSRKVRYQENRETELQRNREYQEKNRDEICEQRRGHYRANRARILKAVSDRYEETRFSLRHVKQRMLTRTKHRAKKLGLPFNLTLDDIEIPSTCPVFGVQFDLTGHASRPRDYAPSVDRFIPALGYIKGNIYVISHRANYVKGSASIEEIERVLGYMRKINNNATL